MTHTPTGVTRGGLTLTLAGQDVTDYVDEMSIRISDTLGQGSGSGSGSKSRASTCSFLTTLGPITTAVGAGANLTEPTLVRNGEIVIYDKDGRRVFGGYATKFSDKTDRTTIWTQIDCCDYWQALDRVIISEVFNGVTDVQILRALLQKYAPWVDRSQIPLTSAFTFTSRVYRNETLLKAIQSIVDVSGFTAWIDPYQVFHYVSGNQAQTAPFGLSSSPNFRTTFQFGVDTHEYDDNAIINRVYFFGGKRVSDDFEQDLSTQANGVNDTFVIAYYPRIASDGEIHVVVNGNELDLGYEPGSDDENKLIKDGGTAEVLVNPDAKALRFNTAPPVGAIVKCTYRYQIPLVVVVTDQKSQQYFGGYLDGALSDDTVVDPQVAVQRARVLLYEQSFGLRSLKVRCWRAGLQAGQLVRVVHHIRQIDGTFIVQNVESKPMGAGTFEYTVALGSWNWDLVDVVSMLMARTQPRDENSTEEEALVLAQEAVDSLSLSFNLTLTTTNHGGYYARNTALGDGHDAYPGFFSITS